MRDIMTQDVPAWYELSWNDSAENPGFEIRIHKLVDKFLRRDEFLRRPNWVAEDLAKKLKSQQISPFTPYDEESWGFGKILILEERRHAEEIFRSWKIDIPKFDSDKEYNNYWDLSATLNVLFYHLSLVKFESSEDEWESPFPQLATIENMSTFPDLYGAGFNVKISKAFLPWLSVQVDNERIDAVETVMKDVYYYMSPDGYRSSFIDSDFSAYVGEPYWVHLNCPGNACGLDPGGAYYSDKNEGYKLVPHNIDSITQQISLLSGIAKICDLARATATK